ncbi:MAG TPA: amidase [Thermoleophilaceae bacterium]|nr:amidase [Thermoleophilaceae bacterium]
MKNWFVPHDLAAPVEGAAGGPLGGVRVGVKDSYDVAGARTGAGSPEWLAEQEPATGHAWAVRRLLDAGATAIGKTVCDEFFYSLSGITSHYGTPVNMRAPGRIPGGSSCGSAAATAGGACDIGLGTDTGGSIRVPSAFCGLYGLRPTHGRVPMEGCRSMAPSFDVAGWMADDAATLAAAGPVLLPEAGAVAADVVRVVLAEDAFAQADPEVVEAAERALEVLPEPDRGTIAPEAGLDGWRGAFRVVQAYEVWQTYGEFVTRVRPALGPGVRERMAMAANVTEDDVALARQVGAEAARQIRAIARPGTVIALPTVPCAPPRIDAGPDEVESFRSRTLRLTCIAGLSGLPQVTVPAGLSLIGWPGGDEALLELAVDRQDDFAGGAA